MADPADKPKRLSLAEEVRIAQSVTEALRNAGITEEDPDFAVMVDTESDLRNRLINMARVAKRAGAMAEAMTPIIQDNQKRKKRFEAKVESISNLILWAMQEANLPLEPIEAPDVTIAISKGRESVKGDGDAKDLPDNLRRVKYEADKTAIKAALKAGTEVPGYSLVDNGTPSVVIRTN
jgi:hypothetical protein